MTDIDQGQSPDGVPEEVKGWNWGAFLLNWIWGIGNNTYIGLLTFVPFVGILVMPFVLGAKGNAWAWRNGRWDDVAHFKRVQRRWAIWGFIIVVGSLSVLGASMGALFYGFKTSDAYRMGVAGLQQSRAAAELLGPPIAAGFPMGSITTNGSSGAAVLEFAATGSKAVGRVVLQAVKKNGAWSLTRLRLGVEGQDGTIDLLKDDRASVGSRLGQALTWSHSREADLRTPG